MSAQVAPWDSEPSPSLSFAPTENLLEEWKNYFQRMKQNESLFYQEKLKSQSLQEELQGLKSFLQKQTQEKEWQLKQHQEREERLQKKLEDLQQRTEGLKLENQQLLEKNALLLQKNNQNQLEFASYQNKTDSKVQSLQKKAQQLQWLFQRERHRTAQLQQKLLLTETSHRKLEKKHVRLQNLAHRCLGKYRQTLELLKTTQAKSKAHGVHLQEQQTMWMKKYEQRIHALESDKKTAEEEGNRYKEHIARLQEQLQQEKRAKTLALSYFHLAESRLSKVQKNE